MAAKLKDTLHRLYRQHGLLSFLLFFVPLIPGIIEHHTLVYITLVRHFTGIPPTGVEPAVSTMFGQRGVKILKHYASNTSPPIFLSDIKRAFLQTTQPEIGLRLLNTLYFDQRQRLLPHSDITRALVINYLPHLLTIYSKNADQLVRSTLIRQTAGLALAEHALAPRHATIKVFTQLLHETSATEQLRRQKRHHDHLTLLETKLKGDLCGRSTVLDPDFVKFSSSHLTVKHKLTQSDVAIMTTTLTRLARVSAVEVALLAHTSLRNLKILTLDLT